MRLHNTLLAKRARPLGYPEPEVVPFVERLPLKLKTGVSGKGGKISEVCCIYEMTLMFSCFKSNDFVESNCTREIDNFKKCYLNHVTMKKNKQERESKGLLIPGDDNLSPNQVNMLLKQFPNIK